MTFREFKPFFPSNFIGIPSQYGKYKHKSTCLVQNRVWSFSFIRGEDFPSFGKIVTELKLFLSPHLTLQYFGLFFNTTEIPFLITIL